MTHAYERLTHDRVLDAVESLGLLPDGHVMALNSYENRVFQIGIEDDEGVVGKFYRPGRWTNEAILEEHAFSRALAAEEIPVIPPLAFNGRTLFELEGFRFTLFPRRGGRSPDLENPDNLEWIGRFIGRIHLLGQAKLFRHRPQMGSDWYGWLARENVLQSPLLPEEYREPYQQISTEIVEEVERLFAQVQPDNIRLHGDCHPGNILWTDAGPHFVDMDDSCNGPAIQDLWMLLSGDRLDMQIQLDALLEGYRAFHDFNTAELALIEPLRSLRLLHYTAWLAKRWDDPAFPLAFPWFSDSSYWSGYLSDLEQQLLRMKEPPLRLFP
jgi:Ser/Thr protein kinase RdoA (MazF antagonist)